MFLVPQTYLASVCNTASGRDWWDHFQSSSEKRLISTPVVSSLRVVFRGGFVNSNLKFRGNSLVWMSGIHKGGLKSFLIVTLPWTTWTDWLVWWNDPLSHVIPKVQPHRKGQNPLLHKEKNIIFLWSNLHRLRWYFWALWSQWIHSEKQRSHVLNAWRQSHSRHCHSKLDAESIFTGEGGHTLSWMWMRFLWEYFVPQCSSIERISNAFALLILKRRKSPSVICVWEKVVPEVPFPLTFHFTYNIQKLKFETKNNIIRIPIIVHLININLWIICSLTDRILTSNRRTSNHYCEIAHW